MAVPLKEYIFFLVRRIGKNNQPSVIRYDWFRTEKDSINPIYWLVIVPTSWRPLSLPVNLGLMSIASSSKWVGKGRGQASLEF